MKKNTLDQKAELFFAKNWKYLFGTIALAVLIIVWEIHSIGGKMENLEKTVAENNGKVVLTTTDGKAVNTTPDVKLLEEHIVYTLVNNIIVPRSQFPANSNQGSPNDEKYILNNSKTLKMIQENYLSNNGSAFGDFEGHKQRLLTTIGQDNLPEYIAIKDYDVTFSRYSGNSFEISLDVAVTARSQTTVAGKYLTQNGTVEISANGTFDLWLSSAHNPYGMKINGLKIVMITKRKIF